MELIDAIENGLSTLGDFFSDLADVVTSAIEALVMFCNMLDEIDARVVAMTDSCGTAEFAGMPINEAISTFRYACGDVIFYLLYLSILFGCLWTIWKLVLLIFKGLQSMWGSNGTFSKTGFTSVFQKLFN